MMKLTLSALLMLGATHAATAGGLASPILETSPRPIARASSVASSDWTGFTIGGMIGASRWQSEQQEKIGERWACGFGDVHKRKKCTPHSDSPEVAALDQVERPWRHPDYAGEFEGDPVVYDDNPIIWGSPNTTFEYTTSGQPGQLNRIDGKDADLLYLGDIFETATDEYSESAAGAFANYRYDFGSLVIGAEAWGMWGKDSYAYAVEGQAGYDLGNTLLYLGISSDDSGSIGADWRATDNVVMGIKLARVEEVDNFAIRAGWKF